MDNTSLLCTKHVQIAANKFVALLQRIVGKQNGSLVERGNHETSAYIFYDN